VLWSDGTPFTAADVEFTWQWNVDLTNNSIDAVSWQLISAVEVIDDLTVTLTFAEPTLGWFQPFGSNLGVIYPKHFWDGKDAAAANTEFASNPIGTGPYIVESFAPNDQVIYAANPNYREPNKPFFQRVILKGGNEPASSVLAVTTTGDWDIAFTLQIDPDALRASLGDKGAVYSPPGTGVEKIQFNFSDPNTEVGGQRSQKDTPHPFLTDPAVREAIATAIDRQTIADRLYGGVPGRNMLAGIAAYESPNTTWEFNTERATQILEDAGWVLNGDIREKDGVQLKLNYVTTNVQQRQKAQAVVKDNLVAIGFDVQLSQVDGSIFFDSAVDNTQNFTKFYSDMQQYTDGATSAFPLNYMKYWYAGPDGENIAQSENSWAGTNKTRYQNPEYDAAWEQIAGLTDPVEAANLFVQLNDIVINDRVEIPLVQVAADRHAVQHTIREENIAVNPFGDAVWNIANWNRSEQ
jgi:peptide/nickel transport system substrate-binding protein